MIKRLIFICFLAAAPALQAKTFESQGKTTLLELYTSEGCSSCPSAERWLNRHKAHKGLFKEFVPVAYHVDYWNYLGWVDTFAQKDFSNRQRVYGRYWSQKTGKRNMVFTPAVSVNGMVWSEWRGNKYVRKQNRKTPGHLKVDTDSKTGLVKVSFKPKTALKQATIYVALLGNGYKSKVTSGENAGETLAHEFVALQLQNKSTSSKAGLFQSQFRLSMKTLKNARQPAIAVWVVENGSLVPLQAAGGFI